MTGLYTRFVSGVLFPLHERLKAHSTLSVRRELERTQWLSRADLSDYQNARLRRFVDNVYLHVPYYRALFRELGISPASIVTTDDLPRLPLLDKAAIRANVDLLKAQGTRSLARFNTGGSTGEPLVFYIGTERVSHDVAAKWRATRWWGVDIGDREVVVWGSPIELGAQDRVRKIRDRLLRTRLIPAFAMSASNLSRFIEEIQAFRPAMLFGYPSALALIAKHANDCGKRMDRIGIRVAFVTSETLYPHQRETIEDTFGCPVANGYGGRDAGFIAHQCPMGQLHITDEDIVVEIVDQQGRRVKVGQPGEIVITHLATPEFPFIRYKTGDIGVLSSEPCRCGRSLSVLQSIEGRVTDFVVANDGTVLHALSLIYILRDLPEINAFKIVQESRELTRVLLVAPEGVSISLQRTVIGEFRSRLGSNVEILLQFVDEIPAERSGKFRYVVSRIATGDTVGSGLR